MFATPFGPGTAGAASVPDDDGDQTQVDWSIPNPTVRVSWADDFVTSNPDWPVGEFVAVTVTDGLGALKCETASPVEVVSRPDGFMGFEWWAPCDIVAGDLVTATWEEITTSVEVTPLEILGLDEETELVYGVAALGSVVHVSGGNETSDGWRNVTADGVIPPEHADDFNADDFGWWVADFNEGAVEEPGVDGDGWIDLRPGTGGEAQQSDAEGDDTFAWWGIDEPQMPSFTVQRDNSDVWGHGFEPGDMVLTVDDPTTTGEGFEPDFETTVEVDEGGNFWIWAGEYFTIDPGDVVTVGGKTLTVSGITAEADQLTSTVSGIAELGAPVNAWIHEEGGEGHETTADETDGSWEVTFTSLPPGVAGGAAVPDDDGDHRQEPDEARVHDRYVDQIVLGIEKVPAEPERIGDQRDDELAGDQQVGEIVGQVVGDGDRH